MTDLTEALNCDPFEGDFGDSGDRALRDKIVRFRKAGECHICSQDVVPGTMGRSLTMSWVSDGLMSYRFCTLCTEAMASSRIDNGSALDQRSRLRLD